MKDKLSKLIGKGSKRDTLVLTLATIIAQSINLVAYPILSRLFTPEEFGQFAVINTFAEVLTAICTFGYTRMIILANNRQTAANLAVIAMKTAFKFSLAFWLIFLPLSGWLGGIFHDSHFLLWMILVPLISLSVSVFLIYNEWCVYTKQYNQLATNKITNASANSGARLLVGFSSILKPGGLIWSELFSRIITAIQIFYNLLRNKKDFDLFLKGTKTEQKQLAKDYQKNASYMVFSNVLNILKQYMPVILLSIYFGEQFAGHFSMSNFVLGVPMVFVGTAIGDVFRQRARESYVKLGSFRSVINTIVIYQLVIVVPFVIVGFFFIDQIIVWVLGEKWMIAGDFSLILLPYFAINFFASILMNAFIVTDRLKMFWQINLAMFLATLMAFFGGIYLLKVNVYETLMLYALSLMVISAITIVLAYIYSENKNFKNDESQ